MTSLVGVLLWEISSGRPPFYAEGEQYDIGLTLEISHALRETFNVPGIRPTINQIVDWLNAFITKTDVIIENNQSSNEQKLNETSLSTNYSVRKLSQLNQSFEKINIIKIDSMTAVLSKHQTEKDFNFIVDEINELIFLN
ncbi:kinase-like domain-containing protein [Rhizophagus clarus]|uniref:Kinase-like domain-containing protein n=1 Tax=Rhizophagus clarus TaxID=94130 RepID=A0A8H3MC95_9GLOM|nr:kinase-like domain-containing protein [Rhizophagus clarus]